jgi:hexosaminidase
MKQIFLAIGAFFTFTAFAQTNNIAIIPEPVSLTKAAGEFLLPSTIVIEAPSDPEVKTITALLQTRLSVSTGNTVTLSSNAPTAVIRLSLNTAPNKTIGAEGYQLSVSPKGITLKANSAAGLFYGVQTLLQLFPAQIETAEKVSGIKWSAPSVEVTDYPRFGWRGLMFDVSRHFFTKEEVKRYIDDMVRYKYNILHLHLTDDEGWRIQIKSLPRLTEVGAWNVKKEGYFGTFSPPAANEPRNYGGFYTHDDIKEIVRYAKERFVNILPEVDVPGS